MLVMFRVRNYMSFKEEAILDMRATSYVQHPSHIIPVEGTKGLLKTTAIYGPNASGKSNFISAMHFFTNYIISQFVSVKGYGLSAPDVAKLQSLSKPQPFMLSNETDESSEFEIVFIRNGHQIQYGFECTDEEVLNEWLYIDDKQVFERDTEVTLGKGYQKMLGMHTKVPKERLYVAILDFILDDIDAKFAVLGGLIFFVFRDFNIFTKVFKDATTKIGGISDGYVDSSKLVENEKLRSQVEKHLRIADVGIKGLCIDTISEIDEKTGDKRDKEVILTVHDVYDSGGKRIGEKRFPLSKESSGTLSFLAYIPSIVEVIEKGGVFVCDEMSARLHPLLIKLIVDMFTSSENTKAQLIFTTHDVSLLNNSQFRRDEVVFIDKNERGESKLFSLSDLKIREDASFSKDYLQGKYGAIPIFDYKELVGGEGDA